MEISSAKRAATVAVMCVLFARCSLPKAPAKPPLKREDLEVSTSLFETSLFFSDSSIPGKCKGTLSVDHYSLYCVDFEEGATISMGAKIKSANGFHEIPLSNDELGRLPLAPYSEANRWAPMGKMKFQLGRGTLEIDLPKVPVSGALDTLPLHLRGSVGNSVPLHLRGSVGNSVPLAFPSDSQRAKTKEKTIFVPSVGSFGPGVNVSDLDWVAEIVKDKIKMPPVAGTPCRFSNGSEKPLMREAALVNIRERSTGKVRSKTLLALDACPQFTQKSSPQVASEFSVKDAALGWILEELAK
jgi:hypothetical protein